MNKQIVGIGTNRSTLILNSDGGEKIKNIKKVNITTPMAI